MIFGAKYAQAYTVRFVLIDKDATDFLTGASFASGDVKITQNEGTPANTTNLPTEVGNGVYALALTAAEMTTARLVITIIDQTAPKAFEDNAIPIDTYGNASAQHAFDLDTATVDVSSNQVTDVSAAAGAKLADIFLRRTTEGAEDSSDGDAVSLKSLLGAIAMLTHRIAMTQNALTVYKSNGSTVLGSRAVSSDPNAKPITGLQ